MVDAVFRNVKKNLLPQNRGFGLRCKRRALGASVETKNSV